jgi:hypothetical protein
VILGLDIFVSKFIHIFLCWKVRSWAPKSLFILVPRFFAHLFKVNRGSRARTRIYGDGTHKIWPTLFPFRVGKKHICDHIFLWALTKKRGYPHIRVTNIFRACFCVCCVGVCLLRGVAKRRLKAISSREAPNCRRKAISLVNQALHRDWDFTLRVFKKRLALDTLNGFGEGQGEQ